MRIISGSYGGRRINPPIKKWPTRPTTDYAREALFNILEHRIHWDSTKLLDLFGGTGMISLEAISRGVTSVVYVDQYGPACRWMQQISRVLNCEDAVQIIRSEASKYLSKASAKQFDLVFADPPYAWKGMQDLASKVYTADIISEGGSLVIEHSNKTDLSNHSRWVEDRKYGSSVFSFFA